MTDRFYTEHALIIKIAWGVRKTGAMASRKRIILWLLCGCAELLRNVVSILIQKDAVISQWAVPFGELHMAYENLG